jgi:hypothetical protein
MAKHPSSTLSLSLCAEQRWQCSVDQTAQVDERNGGRKWPCCERGNERTRLGKCSCSIPHSSPADRQTAREMWPVKPRPCSSAPGASFGQRRRGNKGGSLRRTSASAAPGVEPHRSAFSGRATAGARMLWPEGSSTANEASMVHSGFCETTRPSQGVDSLTRCGHGDWTRSQINSRWNDRRYGGRAVVVSALLVHARSPPPQSLDASQRRCAIARFLAMRCDAEARSRGNRGNAMPRDASKRVAILGLDAVYTLKLEVGCS